MQPRTAFIGAGRLAGAVTRGLVRAGWPVVAVASTRLDGAAALASHLPGCTPMSPQGAVDAAELVFLTVPDHAIVQVAAGLRWRPGMGVVHTSGATEIAALSPAAAQGARTGGFHPMQNFADPETALRDLPGSTVAIEAPPELAATLQRIATILGLNVITLPSGARPLYHAAANFAAPFLDVLIDEAVRIWGAFGVPPEAALPAFTKLARNALNAIEHDGTIGALVGPVSRGDVETVERHIAALRQMPDSETRRLYEAFVLREIPLAMQKHGLTEEQANAMRTLADGEVGLEADAERLPTT